MTTQIADPDELLTLVGVTPDQFAHLARLSALGSFATGIAAEIPGVSRREFLDLLGRYGVDGDVVALCLIPGAMRA